MFVLPKDIARRVILGELDYNKLPYDKDNEVAKGFYFEDQAKVNLELEKKHKAICTALEEACKREKCRLYTNKSGKIPNGWTCAEYKVDFPDAPFDSRHHITLIGNKEVELGPTIKNLDELARQGGRYVCLGCYYPYHKKPEQFSEDGHGGGYMEMCFCGSDLFETIEGFAKLIKGEKVECLSKDSRLGLERLIEELD